MVRHRGVGEDVEVDGGVAVMVVLVFVLWFSPLN